MMTSQTVTHTHQDLRRRLINRLTGGGLVIALLLGSATFFYETEKMEAALVEATATEAQYFSRHLMVLAQEGTVTPDRVEQALKDFLASRRSMQDGHFLIAEVYDMRQDKIAEAIDPQSEWLEHALKKKAHQFPDGDETWYARHLIKRQIFLQALVPLKEESGKRLGYFEGVYQVSEARTGEILDNVMGTVAAVALSVLLTTLLLYPIIQAQHRDLAELSRDLLKANISTLEVLGGAIAKRDSDTHAHNFRVTLYAIRLAEAAGLESSQIRALIKGSFLHDVGKIAVPDAILLKPGRLDKEEFAIMSTHVAHGVDIVRHSPWLEDAASVVRHHHEKVDGSGYPDRLAGNDIPLIARIFALVDVFDALTSRRPYKEAMSLDKTLTILEEGRGKHFDSSLLDQFKPLAPTLYENFGGREDGSAEAETRRLINSYFGVA
jgi:HD-GYP domain-containing protein (c-di-GMP phosphodiesterase class II)